MEWFVLIFGIILKTCFASTIIELRLVSYDVPDGLAGDSCCDSGHLIRCPVNECDPYLHICLQDVSHIGGCPLGESTTGTTLNNDHVQFTDTVGNNRTANPIIFHVVEEYGGIIIPKITAYDEDKSDGAAQDEKMDYLQHVHYQSPDFNNNKGNAMPITLKGQVSSLQIEIAVRCDENFYGNNCKLYCIPDSESYCNTNGTLVCRSGAACDPNRPMSPKPTFPTITTGSPTTSAPSSIAKPSPTASTVSSAITLSSPASTSPSTDTLNITTASAPMTQVSIVISSTTSSSALGLTCHLNQSSENNTDSVRVNMQNGSDVGLLQSQLISRLAVTMKLDVTDLRTNAIFVRYDADISVYDISVYNRVTNRTTDPATLSEVIKELCGTNLSALGGNKDSSGDDGGGRTALIAGLVTAGLLLAGLVPLLAFLYKRKNRSSRVRDEDTESVVT